MEKTNRLKGYLYGASSYIMWGFLTMYWKMVDGIPPYQILAHRILWSFVFVLTVIAVRGRLRNFVRTAVKPGVLLSVLPSALLITLNWFLYIWAVNHGHILQAGLGYFINPLVLALLGRVFYRERLNRIETVSIALAFAGVAIKTAMYGTFPLISFMMAFSFGFYGLFKKRSRLDTLTGICLETFVTVVPSLLYILFSEQSGNGIGGNLPPTFWLTIVMSGAVTATPLILYSVAAKTLSLTVLGFLQYFSPTISILLAILVYGEEFTVDTAISFGVIWTALALFTCAQVQKLKLSKQAVCR